MSGHFADRLLAAIEEKGSPVCVGIDPDYDKLPAEFQSEGADLADRVEAITEWALDVVEIVAPIVPAVKPQIAYFERYGADGLEAFYQVVAAAKDAELIVLADAKRGDIGSTAEGYADAHLRSAADVDDALWTVGADALTVNGYFGIDGTQPFIDAAREEGAGLFVLVRTSNPGGAAIQDFAGADGQKFFEHMARQVAAWGDGEGLIGASGYSCVGAVVGATYPEEARRLRQLMPRQIFLVPGYGAQGATADDCAAAFDGKGRGAIVNASRSVIYAHAKNPALAWDEAIDRAARAFAADIAGALERRR